MKFLGLYILLFLSCACLSLCQEEGKKIPPWCWTKPVKSDVAVLDEDGGVNWAFCELPEAGGEVKIPYRIYVVTPNIKGAGSVGIFYLTLTGTSGVTDELLLTSDGFVEGTTAIQNVVAKNVGDVNKIMLRTSSSDTYECATIRVELEAKFWDFDCQEVISCGKHCSTVMKLAGSQRFEITSTTSAKDGAGTDAPIYIQILGVDGRTAKKILTEDGFEQGSTETVTINAMDVGQVYGIVLSETQSDSWTPEKISVKRAGIEESVFEAKGQMLNCPNQCAITLSLPKPGAQGGDDDEEEQVVCENDYHGCGLTAKEKDTLAKINCDTIVKGNKLFDIKTVGIPNYDLFLVQCPTNCDSIGQGKVYGVGIHPSMSSICKSALYDQSISFAGGIVGVGIQPGLNSYMKGDITLNGLSAGSYAEADKSFYTMRIDNFDMAEFEMRIIDFEGYPAAQGRLEFRNQGIWGTVCAVGCDTNSARTICREFKFLDGMKKNTDGEGLKMCDLYMGENYCGAKPQRIHYMAFKCESDATEIDNCYRELAEGCNHDQDYIIECVNINYDVPQNPDEGTVRVTDASGGPSPTGAGRLEYFKNTWGTVCNSKFTAKSAQVACKQMGYDKGKLIGNVNENGVCSNFNGEDHCGNDLTPIHYKDLECVGNELELADCGGIRDTSSCSHEQDTIIECEGNGDSTGNSQKKGFGQKPQAPQFGKLPLPPIIKLDCETTGSDPTFRGDPGSIYIVECDEGCSSQAATVWGTGIYMSESSICKAAIHAGVVQDAGGIVELIKREGIESYEESINRGITSVSYNQWTSSFVIAKPVSLHIELSIAFAQKPKLKEFATSSFLQMDLVVQSLDSKSLLFKNFLQEALVAFTENPPYLFQWIAPPTLAFDGQTNVLDVDNIPGTDMLSNLDIFTIFTKVKLTKSPKGKQLTILSHSSCGCWHLFISDDGEISFGTRCGSIGTDIIKSGYTMLIEEDVSIVVTYDGVVLEIWVNGEKVQTENVLLSFTCQGKFDIGSYSTTQSEVWDGEIYFVVIYDQALNDQIVLGLSDPEPPSPLSLGDQPNLPLSGLLLTVDGRICVGICTTNALPGTPGAPDPPAKAALGQPDYGPGTDVQEGLPEVPGASPLVQQINTGIDIKCDVTGQNKQLSGPTGKQIRVQCPRNCADQEGGAVIGSMIYNDESSICKAAIHAGFLVNEHGGEFILVISNGEDRYDSSFQNGIQSIGYGASTRAVTFKNAPKIQQVACDTTASNSMFNGDINTKYAVLCPKDCSFEAHQVYGVDIYADDSFICQAAIHAGLMTDLGGELHFGIVQGTSVYLPLSRNGIISNKLEGAMAPRAFRINGDKSNTNAYFKEDYSPANIFVNWKVQDAKGAVNGPSQWTFTANPTQYGLAFKQNQDIVGSEYNYGSILYNKNFDCNDGLYKINVYFQTIGNAVILVRYYDEQNWYALELNTPGNKKVRLVKKAEGQAEVIQSTDVFFVVGTWYRFRIIFHETNLQVWLQTGNLRNLERLININDLDVQRGTVGMGTQGFSEVYFDGISVSAYNPALGVSEPGANRRRVWDQCLVEASKAHRKKFCKSIYGVYQAGIDKCIKLYNYCEQCCDQVVPKIEKILNFACWRGCIRESKEAAKRVLEAKIAEAEMMAALLGLWRPKQGDKCDYKPLIQGENASFIVATIGKELSSDGPKQKLEIKFFHNGEPKTEVVTTPTDRLMQCGMAIVSRSDCDDRRR